MRKLKEWLFLLGEEHKSMRAAYPRGLDNVATLAEHLGIAKHGIYTITVAGTNGKGTAVASLAAFYKEAGYSVGAYFSPHLIDFTERFQINGTQIQELLLIEAFEAIASVKGDLFLSYFEWISLAAIWSFVKQKVELIILEVGLGGRLDAVNVWDPNCVLLTSIAFDHMDILGDTLEQIAMEKAGILRPNIPVIVAKAAQTSVILSELKKHNNNAVLEGYDYSLSQDHWYGNNHDLSLENIFYSHSSVGAALAVLEQLEDIFPVPWSKLRKALGALRLRGRFELHTSDFFEVYDVAHNPDGVAYLLAQCANKFPSGTKIRAVWSSLRDKDLEGMIKVAKGAIFKWYLADSPSESMERGSTALELLEKFKKLDVQNNEIYHHLGDAYKAALLEAESGDLVLVFGSFYTVAACLKLREEVLAWNNI
jgi:dihydrofolate synthase/folylpolyglutamate synthase